MAKNDHFVVLMYHRIVASPSSVYDVTPSQLENHINYLVDHGFYGGDMAQLGFLASDTISSQQILLTFDDGHQSGLQAAEIARKFNIRAAFYLTKDFCLERDDYLTASEIRELAQGAIIGTHGATHTPLDHLSQAQLEAELKGSKTWLEEVLGASVDAMSFPGGAYNSHVIDTANTLGYRLLGNSKEWWNTPEHVLSNRMFNRVAIKASTTENTVLNLMNRQLGSYWKRRLYYELSWNTRRYISPSMTSFFSSQIRRFSSR